MSKRRLVGTNLIVRYLVQDHEKHAKAAGKLFDACDRGDVATLIGRDGTHEITVEDVGRACALSPYEVLTGLRQRAERRYHS